MSRSYKFSHKGLNIDMENLKGIRPVHKVYPGQNKEQDAYLYLNKEGEVWIDYNPVIGGAVTSDIWHKRTLRFLVPADRNGPEYRAFLEAVDTLEFLKKIYDNHSIELKGTNYVGVLTEEGEELIIEFESYIDEFFR